MNQERGLEMSLQDLWAGLKGKVVPANVAHYTAVADIDIFDLSVDVDDETAPTGGLTVVSGTSWLIEYAKPDGDHTVRLLTCRRLDDRLGISYLTAYCHLRERIQTFRIDRIVTVADPVSGEVLGSGSAFFSSFDPDRLHNSPFGWGLSVAARADLTALLNSLVFVARCDRRYHPLEREALELIICSFWLKLEHPGDPDCSSIMDYADRLAPDAETFWLSMERCAQHPSLLKILKTGAQQVIDADGQFTTEEFYWGAQIDELAAAMAARTA